MVQSYHQAPIVCSHGWNPRTCNRCNVAPVGERFYRTEWMGTPPDIAAQQRLQHVMETPPEYQRRSWADVKAGRYSKL